MTEGSGFFDIKYDYTNRVKAMFNKYGNQHIKQIRISREPLSQKIQYALQLVNSKSKEAYDDLFHLSLIVTMDERDLLIEKNETIEIEDNFKMKEIRVMRDVPMKGKQITLNQLMENTLKGMGPEKYFKYNAWTNNCQNFVGDILKYNGLLTKDLETFIYQDLTQIIKTTPWMARKFADFVTHTAGWVRKITGYGNKGEPIFFDDIEQSAYENNYFRNVVYTPPDERMQFVLMTLQPREEIGLEKHNKTDQFFKIESGKGKLIYGRNPEPDKKRFLRDGEGFIIPAGIYHNIKNSSYDKPLKLYTLYSTAQHEQGLKQKHPQ